MKTSLYCLLIITALCASVNGANILAKLIDGFEVIFLDQPGFVHDFHYHYASNKFYAFGQSTLRQIDHVPGDGLGFSAVDNDTLIQYNKPYVDVRLFSTPNNSDMWAVGPSQVNLQNIGYFLPLTLVGPLHDETMSVQNDKRGYILSAISVDARNVSNVLLYLAGFAPAANNHVSFGLIRAHVDLTQPITSRSLDWDATLDELYFYEDEFFPFHVTNRPRIIHDFTLDVIFVVDPNTKTIYSANVPRNGVGAMTERGEVNLAVTFTDVFGIAGASWHYYNEVLYLGISGRGHAGGSLAAVDIRNMKFVKRYDFPQNYSNPRAIAGQNRTLFIGFEGGPAIVKFDVIDWKISGIQRLPDYLHQVYAAWDAGFDHVYFSTYEQHSKVFRLNKLDFCENECSYNGYCDKEICKCNTGFALTEGRCEIPPKIVHVTEYNNAAAIALGNLFAIAVILAVVGWVLYYRKSKEGYSRVL